MTKVSPFSLKHDWSLGWTRLPSNFKPLPYYNINSMKERKALEALASVGVIGRKQLSRLFQLKPKDIKGMLKTDKIVQHKLTRNDNDNIQIYTLGINGAKALKLDVYEPNYWVEYNIKEVLRMLLFFQLCHYFPSLDIVPTPLPFVSGIENNENVIYVYVLKEDMRDLTRFLKWKGRKRQRVIIVVEKITPQLKQLDLFSDDLLIRVVLEDDLMNIEMREENIFYTYKNGELMK